jgi:hypothetical protein
MRGPKPLPSSQVEFLRSTREEQHDLFGDFLAESHPDEALARWSGADVWAQASGRLTEYGPDEWASIASEQHAWEARLVRLHMSGAAPDGDAAVALAEEQRQAVERWYFTCPPQLHREIIEALLDDTGFHDRYESLAGGTAEFLRTAVHANADRSATA